MQQDTLGARIRRLRLARGLSQAQLGRLVHLDARYISAIEHGRVADPRFRSMCRIARGLTVDLSEFCPDHDTAPPAADAA